MIYLVQVDYSSFFSYNIVPIGLLNVGSALKNHGYDVTIVHCTEKDIENVTDNISKADPLWIGFSVMTGPQTLHSALLSMAIKDRCSAPIVWGGIHPSLLPEQCLQESYIDIVVVGEGEDTAVELTRRIESKQSLDGIAGIGYKTKSNGAWMPVINKERPFIQNLDDEKYRLDYSIIDVPRYFMQGKRGEYNRMFSYKASRGCAFNCGFCYNNLFNKRRWRAKSAESVIEDILYLKKEYGVDAIDFYDDEFYINRKRALKILRGIDIPSKTDIRIDMINDDMASQLQELKVFSILVGIESGSERILKLINKGISVEQIKEGVRIFARHNIRVVYSAIIGLPTETLQERYATIDLLLWIHNTHKEIVVTVGPYLPYPGSALYQWAKEHGFIPPATTEGWGNIDRWSKDLHLPWARKEYYYIREYMKFFNYNIPMLSAIAEMRLKHRFLKMPFDVTIVNIMYEQAMKQSTLGKIVRTFHKVVREI
ncbi:MAG: B12-binding domain-containing radical SAM protein [Nitrospirae bacterium]|nr:B12-binding domain-containing radical SAM protein [Nitrospirota bacterium]